MQWHAVTLLHLFAHKKTKESAEVTYSAPELTGR